MRKLLTVLGIVAIMFAVGFVTGCDENNPAPAPIPQPGEVQSIELRLQYALIRGFVGEERNVVVTAIAKNSEGATIENQAIEFGIINPLAWKGSINAAGGVTDLNGEASATYSVVLSQAGRVTIQARSGQVTNTANINLDIVDDVLDTLYLATSRRVLTMQPQQERSVNISATLVDTAKNPVSGMEIRFRLDPPNLGSLDSDTGTTNTSGQVYRTYRIVSGDQPTFGTARIIAQVGNLVSSVPIEIRPVASPANIQITPRDTTMFVSANGRAQMSMEVVVTDAGGVGVPGTTVKFEMLPLDPDAGDTLFGSLTPRDTTDADGVVFINFDSRGGAGNLILRATVLPSGLEEGGGNEISAEMILRVEMEIDEGTGLLILNASTSFIYADNGVTTAIVRAVLKDQQNQALSGKSIVFTSNNNGTVSSPITTDSLGIALAVFTDIGIPSLNALNEREPCTVSAKYDQLGLERSIEIDIRPPELVDNIILAAGKATMNAGSGDTTWVRATCFLNPERTQVAPEGTLVFFEVANGMGSFTASQAAVGNGGVAATSFIVSPQVGVAVIRASVVNETEEGNITIVSNEVTIDMIPGTAASIFVQSSPSVLRIGEAGEQSTILATVIDSFGNPVRDGTVLVQFTTTLGTVDPPSTPTDSGRAIGFLRPGVQAGVAIVTATVQGIDPAQTAVSFIAGGGSSIELSATPLQIQVAGTGGISTSTLRATVRDPNGNLVEVPTRVVFHLLTNDAPPNSCNINDNNPFDVDTSLTSNGIAVATLNSGVKVGPQLIRALTLDGEGNPTGVQATLSTVAVVSGPPEAIDIDVNDMGEDAGGGTWQIIVSARVYDVYRNPVANNIPVVFNILEEDIATIDPGFTGNTVGGGEPVPGLAYAQLTYNSNNTFDPITIRAYCRTEQVDSVGGSLDHILPLQEGTLDLHLDPTNHMFDRDEPDDIMDIRVWSILTDGHQILINNGPILFTSNRGKFWYDTRAGDQVDFEIYEPRPVRRFTSSLNDGANPNERQADDDERGHAVVWLRGIMDDFFLDPFTLEVTVQVESNVEGYDDVTADPGFLFCTRH